MSKASLELGGGNWGTKDGNLLAYAQGNESSNLVPREFTFTRGSDIAATRINSSGLIEKYRENLLLQSNQFDTNWSNIGTPSLSSGQSGYDGSTDAWLYTNNGSEYIYQDETTNVATYSIFAKKGNGGIGDFVLLFTDGVGGRYFDLDNGVLGSEVLTGLIDSKIELVSGTTDWYRCSITFASSTRVRVYASLADNNFTSAATIYIQDAQLEQGLVATSYLESGATTATSGVADNEPRIDYAGGTASLLLEPQRSNLIAQSEYFGGYSNSNSTDEPNATISPERLTNATSFLEAATTGQHKLFTSLTFNGSSTYTFSIFAKSNGRDLYIDTQNSNEWGGRAWFDLTAGTANAVLGTADIEYYGNGWYRCIVTGASTLAGGNFIELLTSNGSSNSTTGDITKGVYIYGAQLEIGSYATSYIPTYGTSVTRVQDFNHYEDIVANPIVFGANDDFTLYYEGSFDELGNNMLMGGGNSGISDGSGRSYWWVTNTNMLLRGAGEFAIATATFTPAKNTNYKLLVKRNGSQVDFYIDGTKIPTTQQTTNTSFTLRSVGWSYNKNIYVVKGNIKQVKVFPTALTDREAVNLTSPYSTYQELVTAEGLTWESPTCTTNSITELQSI